MIYKYFSNGLNIQSEIAFPELIEFNHEIDDVFIRFGSVPDKIDNTVFEGPFRQISQNDFLLNIKGVAKYFVKGGSEVIIDPCEGAEENTVRLYILSTIFGYLLHKNNILALHASSIVSNNEAIVFAGPSGSGKSTLALGLYKRGYEVINDDISSVYFDKNEVPHVYPGYKHLKLWANSLESYGYRPINFGKIRAGLEKYSYPVSRLNSSIETIPLKAVFFLELSNLSLNITEITDLRIYNFIQKNTFRYGLVKQIGKHNFHFQNSMKLAKQIKFFSIERPLEMKIIDFIDIVSEKLNTI